MAVPVTSAQVIFKATYELKWGSVSIGKVKRELTTANNIYTFTSQAKPEGWARLFTGDFYEKSQFRIVNGKFSSISYYAKQDGETATVLKFTNQQLTISGKKNLQFNHIKSNSLDYLSSVYGLMLAAKNGQRKFEFTIYDYQPETNIIVYSKTTTVPTPAGNFDAEIFEKLSTDDEKFNIWLAPKLQYLPVKIKKINDAGHEFTMELLNFE